MTAQSLLGGYTLCRALLLGGGLWLSATSPGAQLSIPDPLQQWDIGYPSPPEFGQVLAAKDLFLARPAAGSGAPWVSPNGMNWSRGEIDFDLWGLGFTAITTGDGAFYGATAVGEVFTSQDGKKWNALSYSPVVDERQYRAVYIAAGNGVIVTLSEDGRLATSWDGLTWDSFPPIAGSPQRLWFGNGTFLSLSRMGEGNEQGGTVFTSTDGETWNSQEPSLGTNILDVTFSEGIFLATSSLGDVLGSGDGTNWTVLGYIDPSLGEVRSLILGAGHFVGIIDRPGAQTLVVSSTDAHNWTTEALLPAPRGIVYGNDRFVAFGQESMTSTDGVTWTAPPVEPRSLPTSVAFGHGRFIAVGGTTTLYSTNGSSWRLLPNAVNGRLPVGVYFANGMFIGPSWPSFGDFGGLSGGAIMTSPDGFTWTVHEGPPILSSLRSIVYGNGRYVAIGDSTGLYSSEDGVNWTKQEELPYLTKVLFGNGVFLASTLAYGAGKPPWGESFLYTSTNGIVWSLVPATYPAPLATFGNGVFVSEALGLFDRYVISSSDQVNWTVGFHGSNLGFTSSAVSAYGSGTFLLVSPYNVLASPDGRNWVDREVIAPTSIAEESQHPTVAFGNGMFVAVARGRIQYCRPVTPPFSVSVIADPSRTSVIKPAARFRFVRSGTGGFDIDLNITFESGGSAVAGQDYLPITNSVVIPAGQTSATLSVVPIANTQNPTLSTVDVSVLPAENYSVAQGSAVVEIEPAGEPIHFGGGTITRANDGSVHLAIQSVPGISFQLEVSSDLLSWTPLTTLSNTTGLLEFVDLSADGNQRFYRARPNAVPTALGSSPLPLPPVDATGSNP